MTSLLLSKLHPGKFAPPIRKAIQFLGTILMVLFNLCIPLLLLLGLFCIGEFLLIRLK